ncbi:MAG: hypothetical protein E7452_06615 [Ruminococcaceae bacterium]|nr:hypothetical protein [Oscillospiraceae bacterium]
MTNHHTTLVRTLWFLLAALYLVGGGYLCLRAFSPETAKLDGTAMLSPDWFTFQQDAGLFTAKQDEFLAQLLWYDKPTEEETANIMAATRQLEDAYAAANAEWAATVAQLAAEPTLTRDDRRAYAAEIDGEETSYTLVTTAMPAQAFSLCAGNYFADGTGCVVSSTFAEAHGLAVGDTLSLAVSPAEILWDTSDGTLMEKWSVAADGETHEQTYTITGIYNYETEFLLAAEDPKNFRIYKAPEILEYYPEDAYIPSTFGQIFQYSDDIHTPQVDRQVDEYAFPLDTIFVSPSALADWPQASIAGGNLARLPGALTAFYAEADEAEHFLADLTESEREALLINGERYRVTTGTADWMRWVLLGAWAIGAVVLCVFLVRAFRKKASNVAAKQIFLHVGKPSYRAVFACWGKKLTRRLAQPLMFVLLLTLAGTMLCMGSGLLYTAAVKTAEAADAYTISVSIDLDVLRLNSGLGPAVAAHRSAPKSEQDYTKFSYELVEAGNRLCYATADDRRHYAALVDRLTPTLTSTLEPEAADSHIDGDLLECVFSAECVYVGPNTVVPEGADWLSVADHAYFVFRTETILSQHPQLKMPEYTYAYMSIGLIDEWPEVGERFLFRGTIGDMNYYYGESGLAAFTHDGSNPAVLLLNTMPSAHRYSSGSLDFAEYAGARYACVARLGDMSVEEFLTTEEGLPWQKVIETSAKRITEFSVLTTDNVNSLPTFMSGASQVIDGRSITKEEYTSGAKVCLVSTAVAEANGLQVGDTISAELFATGYLRRFIVNNRDFRPATYEWAQSNTDFENVLVAEDFTVVGIYNIPGWGIGDDDIHWNTIFVPANAVDLPEMLIPPLSFDGDWFYSPMPMTGKPNRDYAWLVEKEDVDLLEEELLNHPYRDYFVLDDQGYRAAKATIDNTVMYALILFGLAAVVWVVIVVLFLQYFNRDNKKTAAVMQAFGADHRAVFAAQAVFGIVLCVAAALGAWIVGSALMQTVSSAVNALADVTTEAVESVAAVSDTVATGGVLVAVAASQLAVLAAAVTVCAAKTGSVRILMRKKEQD